MTGALWTPAGYPELEASSRGLPHLDWEFAWARCREPEHRTPLPAVGDDVLYRHDAWGEPVAVTVVWLQPLDDLDDPNLWTVEQGVVDGRAILRQSVDPWPLLRLQVPKLGAVLTREARLRGSAGWLPLDWTTRYRPLPDVTIGA